MKKLYAMFALLMAAFMFSPQATYAAEPLTEEKPATEEISYDEEVQNFTDELNVTLTQTFAWIGGFSGLAAILAFALRFIRERGVMKNLREEMKMIGKNSTEGAKAVNRLINVIDEYSKREKAMEKSVIQLISVSNLDAKVKENIIKGIKDNTVEVEDVLSAGLLQVQEEVKKNELTQKEVKATTQSLLEKLSNKEA